MVVFNRAAPMSAPGQKRTYAAQQGMSALLPIATAKQIFALRHVRFTSKSGHVRCLLRAKSGHSPVSRSPRWRLRRKPFHERKAALRKVLMRTKRGIQYVEHTEGDGVKMFQAVCGLGLEGIVSKKLDAPYKSGPSKAWLKVKNPNGPAATRAADGTF
jgi:hypothetical protein